MMKYFLTMIVSVALMGNVLAQSSELPWFLDYEEARNSSSDKPILISFAGSDWCKPCIMLTREVFETDEFNSYAKDNLVLLLADFPRLKKNKPDGDQIDRNEKLAELYNKEGAFPSVVLVDSNEKVIGKLGYASGGAEKFIEKIETLVNK